jgi:2-aminoadipate transaminase
MDFTKLYSERARRMKASDIREILAVTQRSNVISFAGGLPNPVTFPIDEIEAATRAVLREDAALALQYSPTDGVLELREEVAKMLNQEGTNWTANNVMITNGSQQGLDLLGRVFLEPGAKVIVAKPTYLGAIQAFENYLHREKDFVPVIADKDGMNPDSVEEQLTRLRGQGITPKFIYAVPNFQNPSGTVMTLSRRKRLLELAHEFDTFIVEDDPYGRLRFDGDHIPPMTSMDKEGRVLYLGTLSKILVPGFRLAWTVGPKPLVRALEIAKQATDLCTNAFTQFISARLMREGLVERHLPKIIDVYRKKRDIMLSAMKQKMPEGITWTKTQGGLFTFAHAPVGIDTTKMLRKAVDNGVAYVPGNSFYVDGSGAHTMRLNFSHPSDEKLPEGVDRLANTLDKEIKAAGKVLA